jgi:hypothetical protein
MGKKIKHLDFKGYWKSDNSYNHYQRGIMTQNDVFDEKLVLSIVKTKLQLLRKKSNSQKTRPFPNKGNGFDV